MERNERVRRALAGDAVDRPPISFWWHSFTRENAAETLAEETADQFRRHGWDLIKIQSRATSFAEGWGVRYRPSADPALPPVVTDRPVRAAADLRGIRPLDPTAGALGEQLELLRLVRRAVGADVPVLQTVFAPAMVLTYLVDPALGGGAALPALARAGGRDVHAALGAIRDTMAAYARACLGNGADGVFFAVKAASADVMTRAEYDEFGLPYDRDVLDAAAAGWLNMLHLCGPRLYFDVVDALPTPLVNWALEDGNPTLAAGRDRSRRAVIGGVTPKPALRGMSPSEVDAEVTAALAETRGVRMMVGPGCSIPPDTPAANLRAARAAVERFRAGA